MAAETPTPPAKRIIYLNRRVAFIEPDRINVRPAVARVNAKDADLAAAQG